jgi:AAA lid domain
MDERQNPARTPDIADLTTLLEGRSAIEEDDLAILKHVLWSSPDQQSEISSLCARLSNPIGLVSAAAPFGRSVEPAGGMACVS